MFPVPSDGNSFDVVTSFNAIWKGLVGGLSGRSAALIAESCDAGGHRSKAGGHGIRT